MQQSAFCALKRPNYFQGQLLSADDFAAEQNYHREKQRRHNRHCHGTGVVQGLNVSTARENSGWMVVIEPGCAIDAAGNEILLCAPLKLQLPESPTSIQVGIRYSERLCDPISAVSDATSLQPSRVQEGCEVLLNPRSVLDFLPLAQLVRTGRVWKVSRRVKRVEG
jgi:hypothetical protein